jgi:hypothetical protein
MLLSLAWSATYSSILSISEQRFRDRCVKFLQSDRYALEQFIANNKHLLTIAVRRSVFSLNGVEWVFEDLLKYCLCELENHQCLNGMKSELEKKIREIEARKRKCTLCPCLRRRRNSYPAGISRQFSGTSSGSNTTLQGVVGPF